ncbi:hypothetical protein LWI29_009870 [Acer saccharum]|uniref:Uncharacterized protein n=1 Tax=Acer saccharum TaxID=4024 RepID=A0AA39RGF3_ACESA|nr:hypothetical protein LWI29_009870 [Acer saccharum]
MQFLGLCAGPPAPVDQRRSPAQIAQWRAAGRALVWTSAGHQRRSPSMAPLDWRWWLRLSSSAQAKIGLCAGPAQVHQRRDGHLKDFALKEDKHGGHQDSRQGNGQNRKSPRRNNPNTTINTIFGGPHTGRSNRERMSEVRERMYESRSMEINSVQRNPKKGREGHDPITFTVEDSDGIDAKPNDAIVVGVRIAHRDVLRIMIDNGSSADILSARVYDELRLDRKDLEPFHVPLKGFGGVEVRSLGTVKLPVRFGTEPCRRTILLDFVVVDIHNWPYNALLGRPFLNKARAITSTHALKIKFPTEIGVGELKGSQEMARRANLSIFKDKAGMETLSIFEVNKEVQEDNPETFELDPRDKTSIKKEEPTESIVLNEKCKPVVQKRRSFNLERSAAIKEEVWKLLAAGSLANK